MKVWVIKISNKIEQGYSEGSEGLLMGVSGKVADIGGQYLMALAGGAHG